MEQAQAKIAKPFTPDAIVYCKSNYIFLNNEEPEAVFDILLIDAFSSDSVPADLMTREAVSLYLCRAKEDGGVLLHVSNRYLALETVVGRVAGELGMPARTQYFTHPVGGYRVQSSAVVALAHNDPALAPLDATGAWSVLERDGGRAWTDDYSNIPGAIWDRLVGKKR